MSQIVISSEARNRPVLISVRFLVITFLEMTMKAVTSKSIYCFATYFCHFDQREKSYSVALPSDFSSLCSSKWQWRL